MPAQRTHGAALFGARDLIVVRGKVALDQEPVILGVEDSFLDVLAGKALDRLPGIPEAHGDELGPIALDSPQRPGTAVPRSRPVAFDAGLLDVAGIGGGIVSPDRAAPDSRDHSRVLSLPAGYC